MQQNADFVVFVESSTEGFIKAAVYYQYLPSFPRHTTYDRTATTIGEFCLARIDKWAAADEFC